MLRKRPIRRKDGVVQRYNVNDVPEKIKREIFKERLAQTGKELKREGRARLPGLGILRLKTKKATKAHTGVNPFTKEKMRFKAKPKRKVVKFRAAKELQAMVV